MEFVCRIGTPDGRVLEEVHSARDERAVRSELEGRGCHIFEVRRRGLLSKISLPSLGPKARRVQPRTLLIFNQELATLLRSGLPVMQALDVMLERQREPYFQEILAEVRDRVKGGEELSDAFASFGEALPLLYAPTLKAGERSGELEKVLRRFVRYQQIIGEARKRVVSALVYPVVLVGLSLLLIAVMTFYVIPRFTQFFSALDTELPLITRMTLGLSRFVTEHWVPGLVLVVLALFAFQQWRGTRQGRLTLDRWKLRAPILGPVFQRLALSEFCRSLATLLAGGIPVVSALQSSVGAVGNAFIRERLDPLIGRVREGEPLHQALEKSGVSPDIAVDMVKVGEATGALDDMLVNASNFLDEEVETRMSRVLSLLEPVMLVLMGTIVAALLVSVYLPLFSLLGEVRQ